MDYFQGVVVEFLRANRGVFVNTECMIQLDTDELKKGRHWFCDVMAVDFHHKSVYLCEVTYSKTLHALLTRLKTWDTNWKALCDAVCRDAGIDREWTVTPWVFIPQSCLMTYKGKLPLFLQARGDATQMPKPRLTLLEKVVPWAYPGERKEDYLEVLET